MNPIFGGDFGAALAPVAVLAVVNTALVVAAAFILRRPYGVTEVRKERGDTATLVMRPDGHPGFRFRPGQFGWLTSVPQSKYHSERHSFV